LASVSWIKKGIPGLPVPRSPKLGGLTGPADAPVCPM
jgi:hypothetical protein